MLEPGDAPTMHRYREFLTDLVGLERDIHALRGGHRPTPPDVKAAAHLIAHRLVMCTRLLAMTVVASSDQVAAISGRVDRLAKHLDAILPPDPAKQPDLTVCRNPQDRDRCSGFATNHRLRLCRSCENHEQYRRRRRRATSAR